LKRRTRIACRSRAPQQQEITSQSFLSFLSLQCASHAACGSQLYRKRKHRRLHSKRNSTSEPYRTVPPHG